MSEVWADGPLFCDRCRRELTPGDGNFYIVKIEAIADPTPPTISAEDLASRDFAKEIDRLLGEARELTEQELLDQVIRQLTLYLCTPCYQRWIEKPAG